ncbi:MAG: asparagine synthase (glutamine-hydrolyzing) [Acidobacteriia bacterium]|nr:asparagine synthase (glutamine-hydrolyzing) [Terriglobia bacterium]
MCGIAGIAGSGDSTVAQNCARRMLAALARRGPDAEGLESWPDATLAHRRLSIFDLSDAGRQPMLTPDGEIGIVFNGAVYNFHELRSELEGRGCRFHTETDTEVLLYGYREWGIDALVARMRGMFAIGIWDNPRRKLFLFRDRLGVKPLVYSMRNGTIAFASTVRALRAAGIVEDIDPQAVAEFLEFGFVTEPRTIYEGAAKLPAASILEWSGGQPTVREYWRPQPAREAGPTFNEAVEETERLLLRAVELRLFADVPVGALLSGGVDSSLVCWAIRKLGGDVTAFTVGTPGYPGDETADAEATAETLGIKHRALTVAPEDCPDVNTLVAAFPEPFAVSSALGLLRISQVIKPLVTVLLTGDGGDDVFLGYPRHWHLWLAQRIGGTLPLKAAAYWARVRNGIPRVGPLRRAAHLLDYGTGGLGAFAEAHDGLPMYWRNHILGERLEACNVPHRQMPQSPGAGRRVLSEFLEYERRNRFVGEYLTKVDGATMYSALEARSPFLDQELWDFAASLPFAVRLHGRRSKAVLREIARRRIGERVARGRKRGFTIPVEQWMAHQWRAAAEECFRNSALEKDGWIRSEPVLEQLKYASRTGSAPHQIWYLYVLESWLQYERAGAPAYASH